MKDELREKLSAYLDGALSEEDRKDIEERIARDPEVKAEVESLRAVSNAVKGLGHEPLPGGFMARLQSRRNREGSAPREWIILPPAYRPVAAAMSMAIVAFVVWDKAHAPTGLESTVWDRPNSGVSVKTAAEVPSSMDVSGRIASISGAASSNLGELKASGEARTADGFEKANRDDNAAPKIAPPGRRAAAPGKPLGTTDDAGEPQPGLGGGGAGFAKMGALSAPAAPPTAAKAESALDQPAEGQSYVARTEEERSVINERLYKGFEDEKKRMGIVKIVEKDDKDAENAPAQVRNLMALQEQQESLSRRQEVASVRGASGAKPLARKKAKREAVAVKALALKSPEALQAAWSAAGLNGEPPSIDFPKQMALFLTGPRGCGIVSVENRKQFLVVFYKDSGLDDMTRLYAVPASAKPVVVKPAP